jgi:hypothetical protein
MLMSEFDYLLSHAQTFFVLLHFCLTQMGAKGKCFNILNGTGCWKCLARPYFREVPKMVWSSMLNWSQGAQTLSIFVNSNSAAFPIQLWFFRSRCFHPHIYMYMYRTLCAEGFVNFVFSKLEVINGFTFGKGESGCCSWSLCLRFVRVNSKTYIIIVALFLSRSFYSGFGWWV